MMSMLHFIFSLHVYLLYRMVGCSDRMMFTIFLVIPLVGFEKSTGWN